MLKKFKDFLEENIDKKHEPPITPFDEDDFTNKLGASIDWYLGGEDVYIPNPIKQAQRNLTRDKHSFDLIKKISNSKCLVLEIKVTDDLKEFRSFKRHQYEINKIYRNFGLPLEYCYNLKLDYHKKGHIYTLNYSNVTEPQLACNGSKEITKIESHNSLKKRIDELKSEENTDNQSRILGILFSEKFISDIRQMNTRLLFIAYHPALNKIYTLSSENLSNAVEKINEYITQLPNTIDFEKSSIQEIGAYFDEQYSLITQCVKDYEKLVTEQQEESNKKNQDQVNGYSMGG